MPADPDWQTPPTGAEATALLALIDAPAATAPPPPDPGLAADIAAFCLHGLTPGLYTAPGGISALYAHWDGQGAPLRHDGRPWPVALGPSLRDGAITAFAAPGVQKLARLEGVLNDILRLGRRDPVHIDMEDARWIGADPAFAPGAPVLCHNRRADAQNAILWPLPELHSPGLPGYASADTADDIPWQNKADRLVWRGNLSGTAPRPPGARRGPAAHALLTRLQQAGGDSAARAILCDDIHTLPRLDFLRRHQDDPDFDVGLVMAFHYRHHADDPVIAPFCRPRLTPAQFHRFRYQLCLAGYDHPTNFLGVMNSRSVTLKEEDGWQVFYSGLFKPWIHYIPLEKGAGDIRQKLDWARANPLQCQEISAAARKQISRLADPALLDLVRGLVLDGLAAAR